MLGYSTTIIDSNDTKGWNHLLPGVTPRLVSTLSLPCNSTSCHLTHHTSTSSSMLVTTSPLCTILFQLSITLVITFLPFFYKIPAFTHFFYYIFHFPSKVQLLLNDCWKLTMSSWCFQTTEYLLFKVINFLVFVKVNLKMTKNNHFIRLFHPEHEIFYPKKGLKISFVDFMDLYG